MESAIADYTDSCRQSEEWTLPDLVEGGGLSSSASAISLVIRGAEGGRSPSFFRHVAHSIVAVAALTAPITYLDPRDEFRRSVSSAITWRIRQRRGERISLKEARQIALKILADAKQALRKERAAEARLLLDLWDDDL